MRQWLLGIACLICSCLPAIADDWPIWAAELNEPEALFVAGMTLLNHAKDGADIEPALGKLSRAAQLGRRQAHAVMDDMVEDLPEDPNLRVKPAFHYRMAANAGCVDVAEAADSAATRLTAEEMDELASHLDQ